MSNGFGNRVHLTLQAGKYLINPNDFTVLPLLQFRIQEVPVNLDGDKITISFSLTSN